MYGNIQELPNNFRVPTLSSLLLSCLHCQNEEISSNWVQVSWMSIMPRNSYQKGKDSSIFPPLLPLPLFQFWMSNVTSFVKRVLRVPMFHFKNSWNMSIFSVSKLSAVRNSEEIISWVRKVFCQISKKSKVHFWIMNQLFHLFSSYRLNWFRRTIPWFQMWTKSGLWKDGRNNCKTSLNQRPWSRYAGLLWPYFSFCSSYCHTSCHIFYKTLNQKLQMH